MPWCQSEEMKILRNNNSFPRMGIEPTTIPYHILVPLRHDGFNLYLNKINKRMCALQFFIRVHVYYPTVGHPHCILTREQLLSITCSTPEISSDDSESYIKSCFFYFTFKEFHFIYALKSKKILLSLYIVCYRHHSVYFGIKNFFLPKYSNYPEKILTLQILTFLLYRENNVSIISKRKSSFLVCDHKMENMSIIN